MTNVEVNEAPRARPVRQGWFTPEAWTYILMGGPLPLTVRTLNPGAVMGSGNFVWWHQVGKGTGGHCIFDDPVYGVRAVARLLYVYREHEGLDTVTKVISRYSRAEGRELQNYISFVAKRAGIGICEPAVYPPLSKAIVSAVCEWETGGISDAVPVGHVWSQEIFTRGIAFSHEW